MSKIKRVLDEIMEDQILRQPLFEIIKEEIDNQQQFEEELEVQAETN